MNENLFKIQKLSRRLRIFCLIVLIALPVVNFAMWFGSSGVPGDFIPGELGSENILGPITTMMRFTGALVSMIPIGVMMAALWELTRLLALYAKGIVFSAENVACYRNIGRIFIAGFFLRFVYDPLMTLVLTIHNPPGSRMISLSLDSDDISGLFVGMLLILIAWVMDRAREIEDENLLTV